MRSWGSVILALLLLGASFGCKPPAPANGPQRVFFDRPATWVPPLPALRVDEAQKWAVFGQGDWLELVDLASGAGDEGRARGDLETVTDVAFLAGGKLARRGTRNGEGGWFVDGAEHAVALPRNAVTRWSPQGTGVAYYDAGDPQAVLAGPVGAPQRFELQGNIRALEWSHDESSLFILTMGAHGASSLVRLQLPSGRLETIADDLDAPLRASAIGVAPDDRALYLPLASSGAIDLVARHDVDADRDLDIYEVAIVSGDRNLKIESPMDDLSPIAVGEHLYWTRVEYQQTIVALAADGGAAHLVADGGQIPYWSHDARLIGYTVGLPRAADAPLNMDVDVIEVGEDARPTSPPRRLIDGYHEDFTPAWSPDGRWLAFHSHRSSTPVPYYGSEGATDDIYLLRNGAPASEEIRLTDFGWEVGMADWSADGRRLVFVSWERGGVPGVGTPWIATIDLDSGRALAIEPLPLPDPLRTATLVSWSPVGEELAIEADAGNGRQAIWVLDLASEQVDKVVEYDSDTYSGLDWTPDGKTIVYSARSEGRFQLFGVSRSGGVPKRLSDDSGNLLQPQVSPDGRWIAATRIEFTRELWRQER